MRRDLTIALFSTPLCRVHDAIAQLLCRSRRIGCVTVT
jgi:hypothetical protein